ncbi:hypothetical protein HIMB114_00008830 [alpha proteobacterium HIMB114]|nr:hypothetical protein HIMB114_00008830 [alpha proteobacterium HIMB114]
MKNNILSRQQNLFLLILLILLSTLLFRGRLGSDDLEVFNFIYNFENFNGNFTEYFEMLRSENGKRQYYNDIQKHSYYTYYHRFIWVVQAYISFQFVSFFTSAINLDTLFFHQYFSGWILSFYCTLSMYFFFKICRRSNISSERSLFLSIVIFFGTGVISFFTGQFIGSLTLLLFCLRFFLKSQISIFFIDFIIILIKPFYFVIIFFLRVSDYKIFSLPEKKIKELGLCILILICYFLLKVLCFDFGQTKNYAYSQVLVTDFGEYINNLFNLLFSSSAGFITYSLIPVILLFFGWKKSKTVLKILSIFFLSLTLSFYDGYHGGVAGNRHLIPVYFIFIPEFISGYNFLMKKNKAKKYFLIFFVFITCANLPSIEYRNFAITEYINGTVILNKPKGPAIKNINPKINKKYLMYNYPINSLEFNNVVFANKIFINKLFNKDKIVINDQEINSKFFYPQTGIGRLIYLGKNNINTKIKFIDNLNKKYLILQFGYFLIYFVFITFLVSSLRSELKLANEKN